MGRLAGIEQTFETVEVGIHDGIWLVMINGKTWLEFQSEAAAEHAAKHIRKSTFITEMPDFPDEWEDDEPPIYYCDNCDEECEPDGVWNGIFLFYCHSCGTQYEVIP